MLSSLVDFKLILRALQHRNYRLYFCGQTLSLVGTWMQRIAVGWLVYRLTESAFLLGLVGFVGESPLFLVAPVAGVLADRWNRHRCLVVLQTLALVQALILASLVLAGNIQVWHIIVLSIFLGLVQAFDVPIRQSLLVDLIEKREDLGNAIALNSSMVHAARLIGPSVAGVLIATLGEGICFLFNALSYVPVIAALLAMQIRPKEAEMGGGRLWEKFQEGFAYAFHFVPIRSILMLLGLVSLVGMPYQVLLPVFAKDILSEGPRAFGFLVGCSGLGALGGAGYLASRRSVLGLERLMVIASSLFGASLIVFSFSRVLWFSLLLMLLAGFGMMVQMASSNTVLQTIADDDKRGRVMSFYAMAYRGMVPVGSLLAGILATTIGAPGALLLGGSCCVLAAAVFASQLPVLGAAIHPIYEQKGVLSQVAPEFQKPARLGLSSEE